MKPRTLVLALMSGGLFAASAQAANDCNQLFVYAVQQFCSVAPNGQSLCQPFGLVGPAPSCVLPGAAPNLATMPLAPAIPQATTPYNPYLNGAARAPNPYLAAPGISATPYIPFQPFPLPAQAAPAVVAPAATAPTPQLVAPAAAPVVASPTPKPIAAAPAPAITPAPVTPPPVATPAPAKPVNPYLIHSGISVGSPFAPAAPAPQPAPAKAPVPVVVPAPAPAVPPAPLVEAPKPLLPPAPTPEATKPVVAALPVTPPAPPAPVPVAESKAAPSEAVVLFRFNSTRLTPAARKQLDEWLAGAPKGVKIVVTGHADRIGSARYNKKLSLRRAKAVRAYLVRKGLSAKGIQVGAKGYSEPLKACEGKVSRAIIVCLAPNRRVEVKP